MASPETSNDSRGAPAGHEAGQRHADPALRAGRAPGQAQLAPLAPQVALALQAGHVLEDGRGAGDAKPGADLADGRPVAVLEDEGLDGLRRSFWRGVSSRRIVFTILFTIDMIGAAEAFVKGRKDFRGENSFFP